MASRGHGQRVRARCASASRSATGCTPRPLRTRAAMTAMKHQTRTTPEPRSDARRSLVETTDPICILPPAPRVAISARSRPARSRPTNCCRSRCCPTTCSRSRCCRTSAAATCCRSRCCRTTCCRSTCCRSRCCPTTCSRSRCCRSRCCRDHVLPDQVLPFQSPLNPGRLRCLRGRHLPRVELVSEDVDLTDEWQAPVRQVFGAAGELERAGPRRPGDRVPLLRGVAGAGVSIADMSTKPWPCWIEE